MPTQTAGPRLTRCRDCHHPAHQGDCAFCGCARYVPVDLEAREKRKRLWIVEVSFLVRRGWTDTFELRVRALGLTGAVAKGVREARRTHLPRGTRVQQVRVGAIAVPRRQA